MTVPSSGELSMSGIWNEFNSNNYSAGASVLNLSLTALSDGSVSTINTNNNSDDRPDGSEPHAMSEFYAYDHDAGGVTIPATPSNLQYTAASTSTITYTFTEAAATTRVYTYLHDNNGTTTYQNDIVSVDGSGYITVDGSGDSSFTIGNGDDTYPGDGSNPTLTAAANDYVTLKYKSYNSSATTSSYSSTIQGWTLPDQPSNLSGSYIGSAENLSWDAPTGGASSYKVERRKYAASWPSWEEHATGVTDTSDYEVSPLTGGGLYQFRVSALGGGSDYGAVSSTLQEQFPEFTASLFNIGELHLTGSKNSPYNTLPSNTVNDQVYTTFSIAGTTGSGFDPELDFGTPERDKMYFWISGDRVGKVGFAITERVDPGVDGTNNSGTGWHFVESVDVSAAGHPQTFIDNSVTVDIADTLFGIRFAFSGSAHTGGTYSHIFNVGNGPYSASAAITTHLS